MKIHIHIHTHIHIQTQIPIHIHVHIHIHIHIDRVSTYTIPSESEEKAVQELRKLWEEIEKPKLIESKTIKNEEDLDFTDMSYLRLIRGDKLKVYIYIYIIISNNPNPKRFVFC